MVKDSKSYDLNDGHILESTDRLHVACVYIDEVLKHHPLINAVPEFQSEIDKAISILSDLYQKVSGFEAVADIVKNYKLVQKEWGCVKSENDQKQNIPVGCK